jgi:hypothetical protein
MRWRGAQVAFCGKQAYPLFVVHFGVVAFSLSRLFGPNGSMERVGEGILIGFACLWGALFLGGMLIGAIRRQASHNVALDRSLGMIPVIGGMRRDLALSRFSAAYDMQLEAGVNVLGALEASGRASASANYRDAVDKALPEVRSGRKREHRIGGNSRFSGPIDPGIHGWRGKRSVGSGITERLGGIPHWWVAEDGDAQRMDSADRSSSQSPCGSHGRR